MKKLICIVLSALFLFSCACAESSWYQSTAESIAKRMGLLTTNQTYLAFFMDVKQEGVEEELAAMAEVIGMPVKDVTVLRYQPEKVAEYIDNYFISDHMDAGVEETKQELLSRMNQRLPSMLNWMVGGWLWQSMSEYLQTGETFVMPAGFEECALVLDYGTETAVLVTFTRTGDSTVTAEGSYIRADAIDDETVAPFLAMLWEKE